MVSILEVIKRSEQGATRPFICNCTDNCRYFVKGYGAGYQTNKAEWMAGHIGRSLGLPIPDISLVDVPRSFVVASMFEGIEDLGAGTWFGSKAADNVDELRYKDLGKIDPNLCSKILFFDLLVQNGDRTLSPDSGNPNILRSSSQDVVVIDHNLAFNPNFDAPTVLKEHIFSRHRELALAKRDEFSQLASIAEENLSQWWEQMPDCWLDVDTQITMKMVKVMVSRHRHEAFWRDYE